MKTSVEVDEEKVRLAKQLGHISTLKELLDKSLDAYIALARRKSMLDLLGTDFFSGSLKEMRKKKK
ncbi:MAG: type II toxin-antitoxin system VapB family antitoxin [Bacteriovoracia bacterium]